MISAGLSTLQDGGHLVVRLRGELDAVDAADDEAALARVTAGNPRVVADLAALEFIDCCGLGVLIRVRAQARQAGGDMCTPEGPRKGTGWRPHGIGRRRAEEVIRLAGPDHGGRTSAPSASR